LIGGYGEKVKEQRRVQSPLTYRLTLIDSKERKVNAIYACMKSVLFGVIVLVLIFYGLRLIIM
jgi:hypothetical protein